IRQCKRKNQDDSELFTQHYSVGIKRQKLNEDSKNHIINFIKENCPTKSGSPKVKYRQYINDQDLYSLYSQTIKDNIRLVCFKTFNRYKREMKVKRIKSYWGQFDCVLCLQLQKLKPEWMKISDVDKLNSLRLKQKKGLLRDLLYHRILV